MKISWQPFTAGPRRSLVAAHPEFMTTFRKGLKWCDGNLIGETVQFHDESTDSIFATGRIVSVKACRFGYIDALDHSRQSSKMSPSDRLLVMQKAYKDPDYNMDTITTVVTIGNIDEV